MKGVDQKSKHKRTKLSLGKLRRFRPSRRLVSRGGGKKKKGRKKEEEREKESKKERKKESKEKIEGKSLERENRDEG